MNRAEWEAQIFASNMNTTARAIALVVGTFGNWTVDKTVEPGTTKIAQMAGVTRDTVDEYLEAMVEQGWLKPVGTGRYNTTIYELCPVVADTTGKLARQKRNMSPASLAKMNNLVVDSTDNYEVSEQNLVAERSGVSCRKQPGKLPKADPVVADSTGRNLYNLDKNLEEPITPVADAPVVIEVRADETLPLLIDERADTMNTHLTTTTPSPARVLTPGEKKVFEQQVRIYRLTEEKAADALAFVLGTHPRVNIDDACKGALEAVGATVGDDW